MTHEWEKLFVSRGYQQYTYAGVDMCENCKAVRFNAEGGDLPDWVKSQRPFYYMAEGWLSPEEPPCND